MKIENGGNGKNDKGKRVKGDGRKEKEERNEIEGMRTIQRACGKVYFMTVRLLNEGLERRDHTAKCKRYDDLQNVEMCCVDLLSLVDVSSTENSHPCETAVL